MSYYYNYTIGYERDGKLYPLGPYDASGKIRYALSRSRSFASDLHQRFGLVGEDQISDDLRNCLTHTGFDGKTYMPDVRYLYLDELPSGDYIKKGYFLIEDVVRYEESKDSFDLFYDRLSPVVYSAMVQNEKMFGKPEPTEDEFGTEYTPHSVADYMFYAYPDYYSEEYEASLLREMADILDNYELRKSNNTKIVILETEG